MGTVLIFDHGFLSPPSSYAELLAPLRRAGIDVVTPRLYHPAAGLTGRYSVIDEAEDLAVLVRSLPSRHSTTGAAKALPWLAGHSRGGQAVWRAAEILGAEIGGLIVIDPVDGAGPRSEATATDHPARIEVPTLIVGAGRGGSCAPAGLNHEQFAQAHPAATHVVIEEMGHADVLSGAALTWGRLLCKGGSQPQRYRRQVSDLMLEWVPRPT